MSWSTNPVVQAACVADIYRVVNIEDEAKRHELALRIIAGCYAVHGGNYKASYESTVAMAAIYPEQYKPLGPA
jgi:hypothetical protein